VRLLVTIADASGLAGGVVAYHGRTGNHLRAHTPRLQPRSSSQTNSRAILGGLSALWATLPPATQAGWAALAAFLSGSARARTQSPRTGYCLFVSCNRNLVSIGTGPITEPQAPRPLSPIYSLAAAPNYDTPDPPRNLLSWQLTVSPTIAPDQVLVVRASPALSPARGNIRPSDLRIIGVWSPWPIYSAPFYDGWVAAWGYPPPAGQITFQVNVVDPFTGLAGPPFRASTTYSYTVGPLPAPGSILIEIEAEPVATVAATFIEVEGVPVAGS